MQYGERGHLAVPTMQYEERGHLAVPYDAVCIFSYEYLSETAKSNCAVKRIGESARWADLTIRFVVKANSMSSRKGNHLTKKRLVLETNKTPEAIFRRIVSKLGHLNETKYCASPRTISVKDLTAA